MPTTERTMVPAATRRPGELDSEPAIRERMKIGPDDHTEKLIEEIIRAGIRGLE